MVVSDELAALKEGSDGNGSVDFGRKLVNATDFWIDKVRQVSHWS